VNYARSPQGSAYLNDQIQIAATANAATIDNTVRQRLSDGVSSGS
jgi:hypothetical protein